MAIKTPLTRATADPAADPARPHGRGRRCPPDGGGERRRRPRVFWVAATGTSRGWSGNSISSSNPGCRFGVGFITWSMAKQPKLLDIALERKPAALMLSFGDPRPFVDRIKRAGALLVCQIQSIAMAQRRGGLRRGCAGCPRHRGRRPRRVARSSFRWCPRSSMPSAPLCRSSLPAASPTGAGSRPRLCSVPPAYCWARGSTRR